MCVTRGTTHGAAGRSLSLRPSVHLPRGGSQIRSPHVGDRTYLDPAACAAHAIVRGTTDLRSRRFDATRISMRKRHGGHATTEIVGHLGASEGDGTKAPPTLRRIQCYSFAWLAACSLQRGAVYRGRGRGRGGGGAAAILAPRFSRRTGSTSSLASLRSYCGMHCDAGA